MNNNGLTPLQTLGSHIKPEFYVCSGFLISAGTAVTIAIGLTSQNHPRWGM